jgi:outer membrane protein assembly factor BamB
MTTPAFYRGKIYTSGGFQSKEFYAFEATTGNVAWAINLDDDGPSAAACAEGICVINTESCTIFALDADNGKMLWSWWLGDPLMSSPAIADGRVYTAYPANGGLHMNQGYNPINTPFGEYDNDTFAPNDGNLYYPDAADQPAQPAGGGGAAAKQAPPGATHALAAFDLKSGKLLWTKWIDSDVMSSPVAVGDEVYATTFAGTVYKIDGASGTIESARRDRATSAPVVVDDSVYYTRRSDGDGAEMAQESLVRSNRDTGSADWSTAEKDAPYLDRRFQSSTAYAEQGKTDDAANGFGGGAPAAANAAVAYDNIGYGSVSTLQAFQGSRVLNVAGLNINSMGDEVVATDAVDGSQLWSVQISGDDAAGGYYAAPPIAAGDNILVGTLTGKIMKLDSKTGDVLATYDAGAPIRSQPVVNDGWIYAGTADGKIVAIDTGDRSLTGWAMWGADAARTGVVPSK